MVHNCEGAYLGVGVDLQGVGGGVESGDLGDVVVLALTLLLLQLEGDTTDGTALDTLHQMGCEASDLVAQTLRGDDSLERHMMNLAGHELELVLCTYDFIDDALVGVEIESEAGVAAALALAMGPSAIRSPSPHELPLTQGEYSLLLDEHTGGPFGGFRAYATLSTRKRASAVRPAFRHRFSADHGGC